MTQNIAFKKSRSHSLKAFIVLTMLSVQFLHAGNIFLKVGGITTATRANAGTAGFGNTWNTALDFNAYFNLYAGQNTLATTIPANTNIYIKMGNYTWNNTLTVVLINNNILIQGGFPNSAVGIDISGYNPLINITKVSLTGGSGATARWLGTSSLASGSNTSEMKGMEITSSTGGSFFFGNADSGGTAGNYKFTDLNIHDFPNGGGAVVFRDNGAGATGTFTNCIFKGNATGSNGAAINNDDAVCPLTFTNCSFTSNTGTGSSFGGAIFTRSNITATTTSWCSNSSGGFGGAIGNDITTSKTYTFNGCTFSKNIAGNGYGGAIGVKYGNLIINNCSFYENETTSGGVGGGGAVYLQNNSSGSSTITNTVFYKNKFTYTAFAGNFGGGGAIGWTDLSGTLTISGSKFVDNAISVATAYGGAICLDNSTGGSGNIIISNCIFKGNNLAGGSPTLANSDLGIRTNLTSAAEYRIDNSLMQQPKPNYYSGGTSSTSYQPFANNAGAAPYNYFFDTIPYSASQTASTNTFNNTSDGGVGAPTFSCPTSINAVCLASDDATPVLSGSTLTNTCPTTTVDLTTITATNQHSDVTLTWHAGSTPTNANKLSTPSAVSTNGTYYAAFYDSVYGCYSAGTASVTVTVKACNTVSGKVWDDANGDLDNIINGTLINGLDIDPQVTGNQSIYISLIQGSTIIATTPVLADGSYVFTNINNGNYNLIITTSSAGSTTPSLPTNWIYTGESITTAINSTPDGILPITLSNANLTTINFGINKLPVANDVNSNCSKDTGGITGTTVPDLIGSDLEDQPITGSLDGKQVVIVSVPTNATLYFEGAALGNGDLIVSYYTGSLTVDPNGTTPFTGTITFTYQYDDASGHIGNTATVTMSFLPCTCTQPYTTGTPNGYTETGISSFEGFAGGWPGNIPNGFIAIESKNKGFVITRTTASAIPTAGLVEGMLIYDTTDNCVKLYNGTTWHCIEKSCNTP